MMSPSYSNRQSTDSALLDETLVNVKMELSSLCNERTEMEKRIKDLLDGIEGIRIGTRGHSPSENNPVQPRKRRSSMFQPQLTRIKSPPKRIRTQQSRQKHMLSQHISLPLITSSIPEHQMENSLSNGNVLQSNLLKSTEKMNSGFTENSLPDKLDGHYKPRFPITQKSSLRDSNLVKLPKRDLNTWHKLNMYEYCPEPGFRLFDNEGLSIFTSEKHDL